MAEFCLECFNKMNGFKLTKYDVKLDFMADLCEGCGEYKRTVICFRKPNMITDILKYFDEKKEKKAEHR